MLQVSIKLLLHRHLTVEPSKIALPCKEGGADLVTNCAKYGSNWTLFAIWVTAMFLWCA